MSEKLFSVGEKLYELWSHRAKKLNNVKESGTKSNSSSHYLMNEVAKIDFEKWNAYKKFLERLQNHATNDLIDAMWH